jgi:hypothetical protein
MAGFQLVSVPPPAENTPPEAAFADLQVILPQDIADVSRFPVPELKVGSVYA